MAKTVKISLQTGQLDIPGLPGDDASDADKNAYASALVGEIQTELDSLGDIHPRDALKQLWVLRVVLDGCPRNWLESRTERKAYSTLSSALDTNRDALIDQLENGKQVWEDLGYLRTTLELLYARLREAGNVQRLILSALGKLQFCEIDYQRRQPEDIGRVCEDLKQEIQRTADLDEFVSRWGNQNHGALLTGGPPNAIPAALLPPTGGAMGLLAAAGLLVIAGGVLALETVPGVPWLVGAAVAGAGIIPGGLAFKQLGAASAARAELPNQFVEQAARFRERLYLICALRTLFAISSRYTRAEQAFKNHLQENGGQQRWKRVKFDDRDLTELFATESWDPRGTIEMWLSEKVNEVFRLDSTCLAEAGAIDEEAWAVILRAYLLESQDSASADGRLLQTVSDLLFTARGEDVSAERERVFGQVNRAWNAYAESLGA